MSWKSPEASTSSQNHVNQVLTCKVCEQAFSSLKDLSEHMVKNNHYKQDEPRSQSTSPRANLTPALPQQPPQQPPPGGPQQQSKEKRKKSLPVRKLLELERAQQELSGQVKPSDPTGRIACEKCGEKILMHLFVDHIRGCVGPSLLNKAVSAASMADLSRLLSQSAAAAAQQASQQARTPSVSPDPKKTPTSPTSPSVGAPAPAKSEEAPGGPKSILGSLEKMVQDNFGAKKKVPDNHMSILQRLGIDEGVDYNKPLMDPMSMFRSPSQMAAAVAAFVPFSSAASTTTRSNSSECSSPDRFRASAEPRPNSAKSAASPAPPDEVPLAASVPKKAAPVKPLDQENEPSENEPKRRRTRSTSSQPPARKEAASEDEQEPMEATEAAEQESKSENANHSRPSSKSSEVTEDQPSKNIPGDSNNSKNNGKSGANKHPLAELQMLCDKTERKSNAGQSGTSVTSTSSVAGMGPSCTDPGAILAFSWACNQAVVNDSLLKCPFCDTPFISKGAYRHHLSKMHFVKDGGVLSQAAEKVKTTAAAAAAAAAAAQVSSAGSAASATSVDKEENAQSKFQKYSQLAKQLSCGSSQP